MGNYSSSDFDNLQDLKTVLDDTVSDIAQVLPNFNDSIDAVLYFMKEAGNQLIK